VLPAVLAAVLAAAVGAGCASRAAVDESAGRSPAGAGAGATRSPIPDDPRTARLQRVDLLISQWDAAQAEGRSDQAQQVFQQIRTEVDASYDDFVAAVKGSEGVRLQYLGVAALGFSGRPEATALLIDRLTDPDAHLVGNALIALKLRADPRTPLAPVLRLVATNAAEPRRYAPLAYANVLEARHAAGVPRDPAEERSALHLFSGIVADRDPYVRLHVAKALGLVREPGAYELLLVLLKDEHIRIRVSAAAGLERLGDPRGFPHVVELLRDAPEDSRPIVRDVLASYAERMTGRPLDPALVAQMGTSPVAWDRWHAEWHARGGTAPAVASRPGAPPAAPTPGPSPVRVQAPPAAVAWPPASQPPAPTGAPRPPVVSPVLPGTPPAPAPAPTPPPSAPRPPPPPTIR
jgi:HEAT repeat protein